MPPETVQLSSRVQANQGSQDACYSTSLLELYGSRLPINRIVEFYAKELGNRGWLEYVPSWLSENGTDTHLLFRQGRSFQVAISEATPDAVEQFGKDAQVALQHHVTVYATTWTHPDAIAQRNCPIWQFESNE
jgi:hypothetical protein